MSFFTTIPEEKADPLFALNKAYKEDLRPHKVNLGIGVYQTAEQKFFEFKSVAEASKAVSYERSYLPIDGDRDFIRCSEKLVFGDELHATGRIYSAQAVGGTGALFIGGTFLAHYVGSRIYVSNPTWVNHKGVFSRCALEVFEYPYWNSDSQSIDFAALCRCVESMKRGDVIVLHASCHNPTGADLTREQWTELSKLLKKGEVIPFFDCAYQGLGDGIDDDAWAVRYFTSEGHEMLVATSHSKNFSLYGERLGMLSLVCPHDSAARAIGTVIRRIIRTVYSNPPRHGSSIVAYILGERTRREQWEHELEQLRARMATMRKLLIDALVGKGFPCNEEFLRAQKGMFMFGAVKEGSSILLREKYGIYIPDDGRMNVSGITENNVEYIVRALS